MVSKTISGDGGEDGSASTAPTDTVASPDHSTPPKPCKFHFNKRSMHDSIWVQTRHDYVNDDEEHEAHPHLNDFLIPHHSVHIEPETKPQSESQKASLSRPCPTILHKADCASRRECETTESTRSHVSFGKVVVRDYLMILGDHPNCRYGAPVMLGWDYTEYEPLPINEYEIHHSLRRPLKKLYLREKHRTDFFLQERAFSLKEVNMAARECKKSQRRRSISVNSYPVHVVQELFASAHRKAKRRLSGGSKKMTTQ